MMIHCTIDQIELDGDYGEVPSVRASCPRCGHTTESFGTGDASIRRCLVLLRNECPKDELNFYVEDAPELDAVATPRGSNPRTRSYAEPDR